MHIFCLHFGHKFQKFIFRNSDDFLCASAKQCLRHFGFRSLQSEEKKNFKLTVTYIYKNGRLKINHHRMKTLLFLNNYGNARLPANNESQIFTFIILSHLGF